MITFRYGNFDALLQKGGGISGDEVDRKIEEAMDTVDSKYDDTKIFADRASFPSTGTADVLYIAQDTGFQYVWNPLLDEGAGNYEVLAESIDPDDISHIINA